MFILIYIIIIIYLYIYIYIYFSRSLKLIIAYGFQNTNVQVVTVSVPVNAGQGPALSGTLVKSLTLSGVIMQIKRCIATVERLNHACEPLWGIGTPSPQQLPSGRDLGRERRQ